MRGAGSRLRRTAVLLLLALRTGQRSVEEEGRLCRPRRFGPGPIGTAAADGSLPPEGGAGVRPTPGKDRGPDRGAYLHLEVRFIAGIVPIRALSARGIFIPCRPFDAACASRNVPSADSPAAACRSAADNARTGPRWSSSSQASAPSTASTAPSPTRRCTRT